MERSLTEAESPANGFKGAHIGALVLSTGPKKSILRFCGRKTISGLTTEVSQCRGISIRRQHASILTARVPQILAQNHIEGDSKSKTNCDLPIRRFSSVVNSRDMFTVY